MIKMRFVSHISNYYQILQEWLDCLQTIWSEDQIVMTEVKQTTRNFNNGLHINSLQK